MLGQVERVEVAEIEIPLASPIRLGDVTIESRELVAVKASTNEGVDGFALGLTRGAPVSVQAGSMASSVVGLGITDISEWSLRTKRARRSAWSSLVRGASVIDIALWDAAGKARQCPTAQLCGGVVRQIPVWSVVGYFSDQRSDESILAEIETEISSGAVGVKLLLQLLDVPRDLELLSHAVATTKGRCRLAVDLHGFTEDETAARSLVDALPLEDLAFVEDAMPTMALFDSPSLISVHGVQLAAGEDAPDISVLGALGRNIGVVRPDMTTTGGFGEVTEWLDRTPANTIMPHVFAGWHRALGALSPKVFALEEISAISNTEPFDDLFASRPMVTDGHMLTMDEPGFGCDLNWKWISERGVVEVFK